MARTEETALLGRLGVRPAAAARAGCSECRHPFALHSNGRTACRAFACTAGPGGRPCEGYASAEGGHQEALLVP